MIILVIKIMILAENELLIIIWIIRMSTFHLPGTKLINIQPI